MNKTTLTTEQLAYLAGFIDGDGSLECQKQTQKRSKTPRYVLRLSFTLATEEPLKTFTQWFPCKTYCYPPTDSTRSPRHRLHIYKNTAVSLIAQCLPYLIIKQQQAELILEIEKIRATNTPDRKKFSQKGSKPMPSSAVKKMEKLFLKLRSLKSNKRGMQHRINQKP